MKIAVVRGPSLNPWEMQNFLPLAKTHELILVGSQKGQYEFDEKAPLKRLICLGEIFNFVPKGIEFLYRVFGNPQVLLGLEKAVAGFDVVHTAETSNYYSFQALCARRKGLIKKLVVTCWENIPGLHENYSAQRRIKREVVSGADHFLAVTEGARRALIADGVVPEKITVVPMGVDLEKFRIKKAKVKSTIKKSKLDKFTILFVGRLVEEKGVWELLKAFRMVCQQLENNSNNLRLRMVGNGPLRDALMQQAQEWGILEKVIIEEKNYSEMPKVYRNADIFVLPSKPKKDWQEQFGMVLIEAMACGIPTVANKSGAIPEVVGDTGILVESGDYLELAEAMKRLVKEKKLRIEMSLKGTAWVQQNYDSQKTAFKIEKVYQNA